MEGVKAVANRYGFSRTWLTELHDFFKRQLGPNYQQMDEEVLLEVSTLGAAPIERYESCFIEH